MRTIKKSRAIHAHGRIVKPKKVKFKKLKLVRKRKKY